MTKKSKLILGSASLTAVIAIVPAAVISCGADTSTTNNKTTVDNNATALTKINATADTNVDKTATEVAKLLPNNSTNLDPLSSYFNTNLIVSAATKDGVKATYSASVATTKTSTTAVLASATSDTSNTLVITVTMTLGSATSTQAINVTGFPTQDQVTNKGTLITLATNLSKLTLTATSTEAAKTPSEIYAEISKLTNPTLTDLNKYFDTTKMTTAINAASTTADPITATYAINTISPDNTTDGSINIIATLTVGTGSSLVSYTTILTINGFTSANQTAINAYVTAFQANKDIKGVATVLASTISPTTGISMTDIAKYVSGIVALPANVSATFAITNVANSTGSITLSITLTATNAIATTSTITITGFQTSAIALDALAKTIATSYVSTNQSTILPAIAYAALKALETNGTLSISNFSTYFDTTSITTALATLAGTTSSIVLSPVSSDNITNGTLQFSLNLSFDGATQPVAITLTGFKPTTPSQETAANLAKLVTIQGNIAKLTFTTTTQTSKTPTIVQTEIGANPTLSALNTYFPTDAITTALTDGATITDITATLPTTANTAAGTLDFTATLSLGSVASNDLANLPISFTVSGFLTANQAAVNAYVASIDALTAGTITGTNTIQTSDLTVENIESHLHGVPTIPTGSGITLSFALSAQNPAIGSVDITITASIAEPNAASSVANKVTVTGFLTVNQAAVNAYVAKINALTGDSIITAKNVTIPSSSEITNANYLTYLNNVPAPTDGITLSFALTDPVPATGSVDITITASIVAPNEASSAASKVTVTGFITTNQAAVNAYVASINTLTGDNIIKAKSGASLPTTITSSDYTTYLDNVPTLISGITLSFVLSNSNATTGSVDVVITASIAAPNAASAATNSITVNGFLTTDQLKTNAFINKIDDLQAGTITGRNTILPSTLTPENIGSYLNNVPDSTGLVLTYTLSSPNDINGTISITITASITGSTATSTTLKSISVSGFDTSQNVLTKFVSTFTKTYASTNQDSNIPTVAYDALKLKEKTAPLTIDDFSTYFNTSVITATLASLSGTTISSITLIPIGTPNLTAGTLEFTLNLSYAGVTDSVDITLTGFQTTAESAAQTANLAKLNEIKTTLAGLTTINASSTEANKTSQEVYNEILGISDLTIAKLATYFSIDSINTTLGSEVTNTITINNPNTINIKDGTITFTLSLSLGTAGEQANLNNVTFTATGFMGVVSPIIGTVATGPYANYWSSSPIGNTLGSSSTEPSLYIPNGSSGNVFNSSAVIETSGGATLPSYISGISWPSGTTSSDVVSWTETGDNATGTATYTVILKNNKTTTLTVKGFMSDKSIANLKLMRIETSSDIGKISTPATGSAISQNVTAPGITGMYWGPGGGAVDMTLFGGGVSTYSIANSDPTTGSITVLVTFKNGVVLSLPVTGYLTIADQKNTATAIAQSISTNIVASTPLTEFIDNKPITFKLNTLPSWINSTTVAKSIPSWVNTSDAIVTIALPTYAATNPSGVDADYSSTTSSIITVSINNDINSDPATTNNFESAQKYFQTFAVSSVTINDKSQYKSFDDFWSAIEKSGMTKAGEIIYPNGATATAGAIYNYSNLKIFSIDIVANNLFSDPKTYNWTVNNTTFFTCAKVDNTITFRFFITGNIWYDAIYTPSDFPTAGTTSTTTPKTTDTTGDKTTTSSSTTSSTTSKDVTPETKTK